jgi:hypothetical protein
MSGLRWRRLVVVQELYCCAVEAGVTAELGFDQSGDWDGVLRERLFHRGMEWVPEDVAGETTPPPRAMVSGSTSLVRLARWMPRVGRR